VEDERRVVHGTRRQVLEREPQLKRNFPVDKKRTDVSTPWPKVETTGSGSSNEMTFKKGGLIKGISTYGCWTDGRTSASGGGVQKRRT
jgi:hypothetical protein